MITIILDKKEFHPGQTIKGNIELVPDSKIYITDIELCFFYIEEWNYSKSESKKDKGNYKQCISLIDVGVNKFLPGDENNLILLDPIMHLFPFEFKLPNFLYPSFEYPKHDYKAFFRYTLLAKVKSQDTQLATQIPIFILSSSRQDNTNIIEEKTFNVKKWGIFGKGSTKIKASLPMKYFKFSDNIPVNVEIDNTNGKLKATLVKINLVRNMILKDNNNDFKVKYSHKDKVMKKVYKISVRSGEKDHFDLKLPLSEIPYNEFSFFDNVNLYNWTRSYSEFIPSIESNLLTCQYLLKVTVYFDSFLKKADRPRIFLPINIVNKVDIIANNKNSFSPNQNNNINNNIINDNNISKGVECNADEIRNQKQNDFVFDKNNFKTPMSGISDPFNKSKTIIQEKSYIDNMAYNKDKNKNQNQINNNIKEVGNNIQNNDNIINNKIINNENKDNFNVRAKTLIENNMNNNMINEDENQDQDEAPSIQLYNSNIIENKNLNLDKEQIYQKPLHKNNEE